MRYELLAPGAFRNIANGAGILAESFNPATGAVSGILGVTSGGFNFTHTTTYKDYGEDMDNCPKGTMQMMRKDTDEVKGSGTFTTVTPALAKLLIATADIDSNDVTHIVPRRDPVVSDFKDIWFIQDYSDDNSDSTGGHLAIHMKNTLSTGGFQNQSTDNDKSKFAFEFSAHFDFNQPKTIPYEMYIKEGSGLGMVEVKSVAGTSSGKTAITVRGYMPAATESFIYKTAASVTLPARGDSVASGWTSWDGTTEITAATGNEIAVVVKDANNKAIAGGKTTVASKD